MPATVIVGAQWGDEGKGKIVDLLAQDSDLVCRYQGGPNAGHTIVVDGETFKIRQIPSGVLRGKTCVIGAGCVVDPEVFLAEVDELESRGLSTRTVHLSGEAHLIMPWHVAIDQASERRLGKLQIGTTKRGIGPCYADKAARLGIRVQDLLDPKILRQKIEVALAEKNVWLERVYGVPPLNLEEIAGNLESFAQRIRPYVSDTSLLVDQALRGGGIELWPIIRRAINMGDELHSRNTAATLLFTRELFPALLGLAERDLVAAPVPVPGGSRVSRCARGVQSARGPRRDARGAPP